MTPLPGGLGDADIVAWRLDKKIYEANWDSGIGANAYGGRWNSKGAGLVVYCAFDPATAILELTVHQGVAFLDTVPHVLTSMIVDQTALQEIHIVQPHHLPNMNWLRSGNPSAGQQAYGDALLAKHAFVIFPSVVSTNSWNLLFERSRAAGLYARRSQEDFALDTRLNPPIP